MSRGGLVANEKGYAHLKLVDAGLALLDIPSDAAGAILERISRLSSRDKLTIRAAAVGGRRFSAWTLAGSHPAAGKNARAGIALPRLTRHWPRGRSRVRAGARR